jgi:hypothetical protein
LAFLLVSGCAGGSGAPQGRPAASSGTPVTSAASQAASHADKATTTELFAFGGYESILRQVDPLTLRPISGRAIKFGDEALAGFDEDANYVKGPDGQLLAVPGSNRGRLTIIRLPTLRKVARFQIVHGRRFEMPEASVLSWPRANTIIATAQRYEAHQAFPASLLVINPIRHTVRSVPLDATVVATAVSRGRALILTAPVGHVGRARLNVVSTTGRVRSVALPSVLAGFGRGPDSPNEDLNPALLSTDRTAYVVSTNDHAVIINLRNLSLTHHKITGDPAPAPSGKPMSPGSGGLMWNSDRELVTAGRHRLLYISNDERPKHGGNQHYSRPGAVLDSRTWAVVRLFPHTLDAWHAHGLTYLWQDRPPYDQSRTALEAISASGHIKFTRHGSQLAWDHSAGVLVERRLDGRHGLQLNPRTGQVLASIGRVHYPFQLLRWRAG